MQIDLYSAGGSQAEREVRDTLVAFRREPRRLIRALAEHLSAVIIPAHAAGFTFCPRTWRLLPNGQEASPELYAVSIRGHGLPFDGIPAEREIWRWLRQAMGLLARPGHFIGGWKQGSLFYLDVTCVVLGEEAALAFARANYQQTIYHFATGKEILVNDPILRPATGSCALARHST